VDNGKEGHDTPLCAIVHMSYHCCILSLMKIQGANQLLHWSIELDFQHLLAVIEEGNWLVSRKLVGSCLVLQSTPTTLVTCTQLVLLHE
jgi:hypothetical protein